MPRLSQSSATRTSAQFVASVPLDLMNAMYFTSLTAQAEEIDGWPAQARQEMHPDLWAELDFLFTFPKGQPGIMGALTDRLLAHPEAWPDIDSLVRFVSSLPLGVGDTLDEVGIQGLAFYNVCSPLQCAEQGIDPRSQSREALIAALQDTDADIEAILAVYDRPAALRARMVALVQRFYREQYSADLPRRLACLERSVAAHRSRPVADIVELARKLTGRPASCLETVCQGPYEKLIFVPSLDMGPYVSCADIPPIHGLFYPCEAEFTGPAPEEAEETQRLARLYKALSDEQRLRILHMLGEREMYAQEIVERTGLHQSVVSRHLMFMHAVGLVRSRRQSNMKFFSLNPAIREQLGKTLDLFPAAAGSSRPSV